MTYDDSVRTKRAKPRRLARSRKPKPKPILALLSLCVAVTAVGCQLEGRTDEAAGAEPAAPASSVSVPGDAPRGERRAALGEDGHVPDGTTVFDDDVPAVAHSDPELLAALRRAATDARHDGVRTFYVNSGWRSAAYQRQLLDAAVDQYGSTEEAAKWVATPQTSAHVAGDAVDLGESDATEWLSHNGARYGLCQTYANEPWHYELRPEAAAEGCPAMYDNPAQDPRTRQ